MASHLLQPLLFVFLFIVNHTLTAPTIQQLNHHHGLLLRVTKHPESHHYTTQLLVGTPQLPTTLLIHLSGSSLWLSCPSSSPSPSRTLISHRSLHCHMAKSNPLKTKNPTTGTCCTIPQQNPITKQTNFGDIVHDILNVDPTRPISTVDRFLFSCAPESLLRQLNGAKGVLGLGRSKLAFQSQMVNNNFEIPRKLTVCLSSCNGFIVAGAGVLKSLSYTPLVSGYGNDDGYYVSVDSIKVNGRRLGLGRPTGAVELSSTVPYSVMESSVYENFIKGYVSAAGLMNMTMVDPVGVFGVCFRNQERVPEIELVLQSEMVKWRIQRRNLMVKVSDSVMCLGFVDGGLGMNGSMVLGGYQLEDYLLEFDLGSGMMGFSSSLVMEGSSCSNVRGSIPAQMESL